MHIATYYCPSHIYLVPLLTYSALIIGVTLNVRKGVFIATQLNSTQLNSTDPVEQRTVYDVTTYKLSHSQLGHYVH